MLTEISLLIFTLITLLIAYFKITKKKHSTFWESKGVPFIPKGISTFDLLTRKKSYFDQLYHKQLTSRNLEFGGIHDFGENSVFISSPELIKHIFVKDFDHFVNRRDINTTDPIVGKMLVSLHSQEWKDVRNFLTPTFTSGKIRRMFDQFNRAGKKLLKHVKLNNKEEGLYTIRVTEVARRFTVEVIGSTVFGIETKSLEEEDSMFYKMATRAANPPKKHVAKLIVFTFFPKVAKMLKIKPFEEQVTEFFKGILTSALRHREESGEKRDDFLQLMVEVRKGLDEEIEETPNSGSSGKLEMSDEMVMAQCFLFFFAGFDTVANLVSFGIYLLAANQGIQDKVRENVIGAVGPGSEVTYDSAAKMDYLDMFISELLRMYLSAPRLERKCTRDYKIPGSEFTIPKGMMVMTDPMALHYDPQYYPNPEEFDPERFSVENKSKRSPYVYLPFGIGPRNCIGMRFGLIETKVALADLVLNFDILPTAKTPIPVKMDKMFGVYRVSKDLEIGLKFRNS